MNPSEYKTMFEVEERHWWYVGMQTITQTLIAQAFNGRHDLQILDAGCGTGAVMRYLGAFGQVTGGDISPLALQFCQQRQLSRLTQTSVMHLPFPSDSFDLVTSFDVIYHQAVSEYRQALSDFWRVLKPNGRLFLRVPAYNWLRGHHDDVVHTKHRFTAPELGRALAQSGFIIEKLSYTNTLLFPLALAKRLAERLQPPAEEASDVQANPEWQDKLFVQFLNAEAKWLSRASLPFGLTVLAMGRKPL